MTLLNICDLGFRTVAAHGCNQAIAPGAWHQLVHSADHEAAAGREIAEVFDRVQSVHRLREIGELIALGLGQLLHPQRRRTLP